MKEIILKLHGEKKVAHWSTDRESWLKSVSLSKQQRRLDVTEDVSEEIQP